MMRKKKRSFFERLTGAVQIEDEMDYNYDDTVRHIEPTQEDEPVASEQQEAHHEAEESEGQLSVDVYQTPTNIVIKTMVAGVRPDDLDLSITRDMVTIKGKREMDRTVSNDTYYHRELYWGSFSRSILLPEEIDVEEAEAVERHGLLIITLPKVNKNKQTKLKIKSN